MRTSFWIKRSTLVMPGPNFAPSSAASAVTYRPVPEVVTRIAVAMAPLACRKAADQDEFPAMSR